MKAKILVLLITAITAINSAVAEPLPFGCYVTDTERAWFQTNFGYQVDCYVIQEPTFSWLTPANTSLQGLVDTYGDVAASLINVGYEAGVYGNQCKASYDSLNATYKQQASLVKKLRKACGSKCRRIK